MSNKSVREELEAATGLKAERKESHDEYVKRLCDTVEKLPDTDWKALSQASQDFFNDFCDANNDNKPFPQFPEAPAPAARGRRETAKADTKAAVPAEEVGFLPGDEVIVTNKRNKVFEGEFVEFDGDTAIVNVEGTEMEFPADRTASMVLKNPPPPETPEGDGEPVEGDTVTLVTKRNAEVTGKVVEITDDVIVLEWDGKEQEYRRDRVASIAVHPSEGGAGEAGRDPEVGDIIKAVTKRNKEVEGKVVEIDGRVLVVDVDGKDVDVDMDTAKSIEIVPEEKAAAPAARGRRETTKADTKAAAPEAPSRRRGTAPAAEAGKAPKVTNADNGGVSVTGRMREMLCEDPEITAKELGALLTKEKLVFKDATLQIVFKEFNKIIALLKTNKHFK